MPEPVLFTAASAYTDTYFSAGYQVARDNARFLMNLPDRNDYQLVVSPNWITEPRRKVREAGGGR